MCRGVRDRNRSPQSLLAVLLPASLSVRSEYVVIVADGTSIVQSEFIEIPVRAQPEANAIANASKSEQIAMILRRRRSICQKLFCATSATNQLIRLRHYFLIRH